MVMITIAIPAIRKVVEEYAVVELYKLNSFAKWARDNSVSDTTLRVVVSEMSRGLLGDRLGAHVYKKRMKVEGRGKRAGARVIVLFRDRDESLFLYGYCKNTQSDISQNEEKQLRLFALEFMALTTVERIRLKNQGKLVGLA
jgi:hypothetical protein